MAFLTIGGGTHYTSINLTDYEGVIVNGDATVDSWVADSSKTVKVTNGATLTTGAWDTKLSVTVDMTGQTFTGGNAWNAINYTGSGSFAYGKITLEGGTQAGGYALDNDLYVGNYVYYNDPDYTSSTTTVNINGAVFDVVYGGTDYKTANANAFSFKAQNVKNNLCWAGITNQFSGNTPIVIYSGSGYKPTSDAPSTKLYSDTLFQGVSFVTDCKYGVHLLCGSGDITAIARDTDFASVVLYTMYNSTSVANGTVYLENCTFVNFNGVRSKGTASEAYTVSIVNRPGTETLPSLGGIKMGSNPYTVGSLRMNLDNILVTGNVTFGKSNNYNKAIVLGGATATITGSTIGSFYAVNQPASSTSMKTASEDATDSIHEYTGNVSVEFSGSTIIGTLFLGLADTSAVNDASGKTLYSRNVLHDSLIVTIRDNSRVKTLAAMAGGTIEDNLEVNVIGSSITSSDSAMLGGGTVGNLIFNVSKDTTTQQASYINSFTVAQSGVVGGDITVNISGCSIGQLLAAGAASTVGGDISLTLSNIQTKKTITVADAAATFNGNVNVNISDAYVANSINVIDGLTLDSSKSVNVNFDHLEMQNMPLCIFNGNTASVSTGSTSISITDSLISYKQSTLITDNSTINGDLEVTLSGSTLRDTFSILGGVAGGGSVTGNVTVNLDGATFANANNAALLDHAQIGQNVTFTGSDVIFVSGISMLEDATVGGNVNISLTGGTYYSVTGFDTEEKTSAATIGGLTMSLAGGTSNAAVTASGYGTVTGDVVLSLSDFTVGKSIELTNGGTVGGSIYAYFNNVTNRQQVTFNSHSIEGSADSEAYLTISGANDLGTSFTSASDGKISTFTNITINAGATLDLNYLKYTQNQKITLEGTGFTGIKRKVVTSDRTDITYTGTITIDNNDNLASYQEGTGFNLWLYQYRNHDTVYVNSTWSNQEKLAEVIDNTAYYQANAWATVGEALTASAEGGTVALAGGEFAAFDDTTRALRIYESSAISGALNAASVTIDAEKTLTANAGSSITCSSFTNNGTLTLADDATLTITNDSVLGTISGAHTLMVNATAITGTSYTTSAPALTGEATLSGVFISGGTLYYYNVVDSTITETTVGQEVTVTIDGVETKAIYGVNAFTSTDAAKAAHPDAYIVFNSGKLGGGTNVLDSKTKITDNLYGGSDGAVASVDLTLNGASSSKTVLGGGSTLASSVSGNIELTLTDATVDRIVYGGGQSGSVGGSITTTVSGDSKIGKNFYGGSLISSATSGSYTAGAVSVSISGGSFGGHVVGGSRLNGSSVTASTLSQTVASVTLDISGGTFDNKASLFAGGYVVGNGETTDHTDLSVTNGVTMTLNADVVTTNAASGIYGGALASSMGVATVSKGVSITVEGGHYSNVWGGGWAESKATSSVSGGVTINVTGGSINNLFAGGNNDTSGAKANVTGNAVITLAGGTVNNVYASSKYGTSKITGSSKVIVASNMEISGKLSGFNVNDRDSVVAGTEEGADGKQTLDLDASVSCGQVLGFDVWEVAKDATLATTSAIDLEDVTLKLDAAAWTVASGSAISNLADAAGVTIGGVTATLDGSCWKATVDTVKWELSVDNTGKLLTLAKA